MVCGWPMVAGAQLQLLSTPETQQLFAGAAKTVSVTFSNPSDENFAAAIRLRLFQTSSATAVKLGEWPWKKLEVLPHQTILESAQMDFPAVDAETKFLVQWAVDTNQVIGTAEIRVYPTNLMSELKPMTSDSGLGVFDPQNVLKPLLKNLSVDFTDLEDSGVEHFPGKLAILGPFASKSQMRPELEEQIKALAKSGTAVVWLLPPPEKKDKLAPSFYSVMETTNAVVIVQVDQVSKLPENPQAQMNLIYFCKLALKPEPLVLPNLLSWP
jgi:hypothetical protein